MPEMSKKVVPPHMEDKEPSEKVIALGKKITDVLDHKLHGVKVSDPEYWGLAEIVTEEMAEVGLTMKLRTHYTFEQLCKMNPEQAKDPEHFQKLLDEMSYIGLLEYDYGYHYDHNGRTAPQSERRYLLPMFVPGSAELFNMDETNMVNNRIKEHPALASFFERMTYIPLEGITQLVPEGGAGVGMHVIPVEKAISAESQSIDIEHLSYWLKKYEGHIGVGQCSCRVCRKALGEGCADDEFNWCIGVGDFADYCRETGKGHDISYEEAMRILKVAEDNGFVHQITNIDGENKIFGICNCNVNICNALRTSQLFNTPNMSRSAYTAVIDPEDCVACGKCVEYCPAGAVKLGQKLCTKDGPVEYPKALLPDHLNWGPEKYNENYRDDNRINCYPTGTAPCKSACPAHIAVQGYINMVKNGRYEDALKLIKKDNPFPAICGRVCNKRCEDACTRGTIDEAVSIDEIKKFVAELDLHAETRYVPEVVTPSNRFSSYEEKIAIIGAGPAGLSCAYYLATRGYKPTVFEKNQKPGGMLTYGIPSFKLEKDVIEAEIDIIRELGVEIKCGVTVGKDITIEDLRKEGYKAFYVAIGCQGGKLPGIPGEDANDTIIAVDFLHNAVENKEDLPKNVVVIGGGNVAIDCARTAHRLNAKSVTMVCLEDEATMPASKEGVEEIREENTALYTGFGPKEIHKDENGNVTSITFKKCIQTIDPETKRFNPLYDESEVMTLEADYIIYAIGQAIEWNHLLDGTNVEYHHGNYPVGDALTYQTNEPDIFVGGDVFTGPRFAIEAIEAGKCAAESLHRYVHEGASLTIGRNKRDFHEFDKNNLVIEGYDTSKRHYVSYDESIDHTTSFRDGRKVFTEEEAVAEAKRCLGCGASVVDPNKCIGCGICTTKCEFNAIHLVRDHPKASTMVPSEKKFKKILPYAIKRGMKIMLTPKTPQEKQAQKEHKEYKKAQKKANK